jgi:hypothetical protein
MTCHMHAYISQLLTAFIQQRQMTALLLASGNSPLLLHSVVLSWVCDPLLCPCNHADSPAVSGRCRLKWHGQRL